MHPRRGNASKIFECGSSTPETSGCFLLCALQKLRPELASDDNELLKEALAFACECPSLDEVRRSLLLLLMSFPDRILDEEGSLDRSGCQGLYGISCPLDLILFRENVGAADSISSSSTSSRFKSPSSSVFSPFFLFLPDFSPEELLSLLPLSPLKREEENGEKWEVDEVSGVVLKDELP